MEERLVTRLLIIGRLRPGVNGDFLGRLLVHRSLPIGAIKVLHFNASYGRCVETVRHHSVSVRVGPWLVETLYTTDTTEHVLRAMCVERVGCQIILTLDQFESAFRDNEVAVLFLGADATTVEHNQMKSIANNDIRR